MRSLTNELLSDGVLDVIDFGAFGFDELSVHEVAVDSSEVVFLELAECQHPLILLSPNQ